MEKTYHIVERSDSESLADCLVKNGQGLLPMVELIEQSQKAVDDLIDGVGRATIEAVLKLSAQGVAGPPHPGKKGGAVGWHGRETGTVCLRERKLRVKRPRLRQKEQGEGGEVPAYEAMRAEGKLSSRMLEILLRGVSTRQYAAVLPQMAETVGVSKSSVSREAIEASEEELRRLCERRLESLELLILYVDGLCFGEHQVLVAVGVDEQGQKHALGLAEGASENSPVVKGLLEDLVQRGLKTGRKYLFVIDGSKALRAAIEAVFGREHPVQRCRNHKLENVSSYLPQELKGQVKTVMRAAFRLPAKEGMARLEKQAEWLEREYPSAAASLREGLAEMFTVTNLNLSTSLARCLVSTNVIESPHSGVRLRTRQVCRWRDGKMVLRWAAAALLMTEKNFRRIMGYKDLWMLKAALGRNQEPSKEKAA
ncbi:MAG TPA: IS256 family transposase [Terriglobia bacterium]|nr:IS256 family transposase [Terriglobia bacterium]